MAESLLNIVHEEDDYYEDVALPEMPEQADERSTRKLFHEHDLLPPRTTDAQTCAEIGSEARSLYHTQRDLRELLWSILKIPITPASIACYAILELARRGCLPRHLVEIALSLDIAFTAYYLFTAPSRYRKLSLKKREAMNTLRQHTVNDQGADMLFYLEQLGIDPQAVFDHSSHLRSHGEFPPSHPDMENALEPHLQEDVRNTLPSHSQTVPDSALPPHLREKERQMIPSPEDTCSDVPLPPHLRVEARHAIPVNPSDPAI